jgi:hypothetical protein
MIIFTRTSAGTVRMPITTSGLTVSDVFTVAVIAAVLVITVLAFIYAILSLALTGTSTEEKELGFKPYKDWTPKDDEDDDDDDGYAILPFSGDGA